MTTIILNQEEYILADDLFKSAPVYCKVSRTSRDLIKKKKIVDYIFARLVDDAWIITDGKSSKLDKILIRKTFYDGIPTLSEARFARQASLLKFI